MKEEERITETTEVMLLIKNNINMRKKAILPIFVQIFIHLVILTVTANFLLLAVKWPKILVLAVMPTPPPPI